MLNRSPCLFCGAVDESQASQLCRECYTDIATRTPGACLCCGAPAPVTGVCPHCFPLPPAFDSCIAACIYRYPVDLVIKKMKYRGRLDVIRSLSLLLLERIRLERIEPPECIVPTPLHSARLRQRGFNQAREIAHTLGKQIPVPVDDGLLRRHKATTQQYDLNPSNRRMNVNNAFSLVKSMRYKRIAVVDDVVTTGATAGELARLLKRHGADHVQVWCLARAAPLSS